MIDYKDQLRLQAYLDGELSASEEKEITDLLAKDPESAALLTELRQTSQALAGFEEGLKLPESREFFWSKVQRGIESQENRASAVDRSAPVPWSVRLRRFLVPASGLAVIASLVLVVTKESGGPADARKKTKTIRYKLVKRKIGTNRNTKRVNKKGIENNKAIVQQ